MDDAQLLTALAEILAEEAGTDPEAVRPEASLEELGVDSLGRLAIAVTAEGRFGVRLPDAEIAGLRTVGDVLAAVRRHRSA